MRNRKLLFEAVIVVLLALLIVSLTACGPSSAPSEQTSSGSNEEVSQQDSEHLSQEMPKVWWDSFRGKLVLLHGDLETDVDTVMHAIGERNVDVKKIHLSEDVNGNSANYQLSIGFVIYRNSDNVIDKVKDTLGDRGYQVDITDGGHKIVANKEATTLVFTWNDTSREAMLGISTSLKGDVDSYEWGIKLAEVYGMLWHMDHFSEIIEMATGGGVPENLYWGDGHSQLEIDLRGKYVEVKYMAHIGDRLNSSLANSLAEAIHGKKHSSGGITQVAGTYGDIATIGVSYDAKKGDIILKMRSKDIEQ